MKPYHMVHIPFNIISIIYVCTEYVYAMNYTHVYMHYIPTRTISNVNNRTPAKEISAECQRFETVITV